MPDYQKGKIYRIISPSKNLVYYGSTTQTLSRRLIAHIKRKNDNNERQYTSTIILDCEDYKIELVEEYPCNNKEQLDKKEGEYIKANECVNKRIEGRTKIEYDKEHREQKLKYLEKYRETKKQNNLIYKWLLMTGIIV